MVEYEFYRDVWGGSVPQTEFAALVNRAAAQLERYKRIYHVHAVEENSEAYAVCAMVDALYSFWLAESGELLQSIQLGSLQVDRAEGTMPDLSAAAKSRELYRCASLYLEIHRGASRCCK